MIFFRHFIEYCKEKANISIIINNAFGQNIVSLFLFYSGYGINESFIKKGYNYIKTLPIKSFIFTIKSEIIILIFLFNNLLLGLKISIKQYLYACIFKSGIGNSYWFAFAIISLYFYSYLSFYFIKNKKFNIIGIFFMTILCNLILYFNNSFIAKLKITF